MVFSSDIWNKMTGLTALIIGDVMLDKYIWGSIDRISPEAPVPVVHVKKKDARLGGAANVAVNIKALGATPLLCAVTGEDESGEILVARLKDQDISDEGIIRLAKRPTTTKTRIISGHHHVVRIDDETDVSLAEDCLARLTDRIMDLMPRADVIIFEDYDKGVVSVDLIKSVVDKAKVLGIPVVVDPKKRNFLSYHGVQLFKPNLKELAEGLNREIDKSDSASVSAAIDELRGKIGCDHVLVTLSEYGVFADSGSEKFNYPAHRREIADVSGAGDSVISVAALAYALKLPLNVVALLANLAGGLVCEHPGVVPIELDKLKKEAEKEFSV